MASKIQPDVSSSLAADGTLTVIQDYGLNADNSPAQSRWDVKAQQIGLHMLGVQTPGHPFNRLSIGDQSAAVDAYNQFKKNPNNS